MKLTRTEIVSVVAVAVIGVALFVAILMDSWRWSLLLLGLLLVTLSGVIVLVVRRQDAARSADLERIEQKIDNVALRVVTESQATHRELSGLIEQLGADLNRREAP